MLVSDRRLFIALLLPSPLDDPQVSKKMFVTLSVHALSRLPTDSWREPKTNAIRQIDNNVGVRIACEGKWKLSQEGIIGI
jgi:predicted FMN-binding regulatory protein PaiB